MTEGGTYGTMSREPFAHKMGRRPIVALVVVCAAVAALALPGVAGAGRSACAEAVLGDWTKGALDSSYSPECYEAAIDALPEDLRAYTTAADDITRAAIAASRAANDPKGRGLLARTQPVGDESLRAFPIEAAVLGAILALIVSGGGAAALRRRRRGE